MTKFNLYCIFKQSIGTEPSEADDDGMSEFVDAVFLAYQRTLSLDDIEAGEARKAAALKSFYEYVGE